MDDTTMVKAIWEGNTEYQKELLNLFDMLENSPKEIFASYKEKTKPHPL